jgi:hypothetical protein
MQRNRQRAGDAVPTDSREDNSARVISRNRIADPEDAEMLDDAEVSHLIEGRSIHLSGRNCSPHTEDAQVEPRAYRESLATKHPGYVLILMAAILFLSTTVAFLILASRTPGIASILFLIIAVLTPFAVASVMREESMLTRDQNTHGSSREGS